MKKLLVIGSLFLLMSCNDNVKTTNSDMRMNGSLIYIHELDGCEYISFQGGKELTHKGNCKFCLQRKCQ